MKGLNEAEGIETEIGYVKEVDFGKVTDCDLIVLGAPNHMGRPSQTMKKFVNRLAELDLKARDMAIFGTYAGRIRTVDRAVKKLGNIVEKKLPDVNLISPSLSVRVNGITGPVVESELLKCVAFGKKIASQLQK